MANPLLNIPCIGYYKLDLNDNPVPVQTFQEYYDWKNSLDKSVQTGIGFTVEKTKLDGVTVSTVFLGSDHGYNSDKPVLWETMVFSEGDDNEDCQRYTSQAEAIAGHWEICKRYRKND